MTHHSLQIARTAHYYTLGTPGNHIRHYWLVCHGYAQLADELLAAFTDIEDGQTLVVAPEGLNYFYKKGFGGAPGATWMTKQHRLSEIEDYTAYLSQLHGQVLAQLPQNVRITVLGFSQGVTTICRWMMREQPALHQVVFWAGLLPEGEPLDKIADFLKDKKCYYYYGDKDPFIQEERLALTEKIKQDNGFVWEMHRFAGGHELPGRVVKALWETLLLNNGK